MMEVVVTSGAVRRAKLQSECHHQQTNIKLCYRPDAFPVAQPTVSEHCRKRRSMTEYNKLINFHLILMMNDKVITSCMKLTDALQYEISGRVLL